MGIDLDAPWHIEAAEWLANGDTSSFDSIHWLHEALAEREQLIVCAEAAEAALEAARIAHAVIKSANLDLGGEVNRLQADVARLRGLLKRYGDHDGAEEVCRDDGMDPSTTCRFLYYNGEEPCDCGYTAALAEPGES